ncbi:hypothetical protein E2562_006861 [Oryza meyeriana var. granulata]|uniref:Uncharacterized protein n=1 Tax=Oryza meyeriana var. granulata TaxID=110450 RepID=A0A6G1C4Q5_9ORYZ|nr:hypothetical protein E2562_006861 [Oryza meyeriana var. granulata]KAF0895160.1 hypothetical protein E2562_006861 [Oryza meyeriana var. granulata]
MATNLPASRHLRLVPCIRPPDRCPSSSVRWSHHPGVPVSAAAATDPIIEPLCSADTATPRSEEGKARKRAAGGVRGAGELEQWWRNQEGREAEQHV